MSGPGDPRDPNRPRRQPPRPPAERGSLEGPPPPVDETRPVRRRAERAKPDPEPESAPTAPNGRADRRHRARRRRRRVVGAFVAVAVVAGGVGAWALLSGGDTKVKAAPVRTTTSSTTTTTPVPPPATTATSKVAKIDAFESPADGAKVINSFSDKTEYGLARTFLVTDRQPGWLHVLLPQRPNGSSGWIRESDVTLGESHFSIKIELGGHKVTLYKDGQVVLETQAVIGKQQTPTPLGKFYITDPVDLQSHPSGAYGAYALGLSGYSEVLTSFNGGPGQIALHGTPNADQVGQDLSNGCVRIPNDVILNVVNQQPPLGTPVEIDA